MWTFIVLAMGFGLYGFLTCAFSFLVWVNTWEGGAEDCEMRNFWKWGVVILLLVVFVAFLAGPPSNLREV